MGVRDVIRQIRLLPTYLRLSVLSLAENKAQIWGAFFSTSVNLVAYVVFWNIITLQVPILTGAGIAVLEGNQARVLLKAAPWHRRRSPCTLHASKVGKRGQHNLTLTMRLLGARFRSCKCCV